MATKIINGTVFLAGELQPAELLIEEGKIQALGTNLPAAEVVIDAQGKLVTPG